MKQEIHISVRDLVEFVTKKGDLSGFFDLSSRSSAHDGIRGHQKIQRSRPENYNSEVMVSYQFETEKFYIYIHGRIDGVFEEDGSLVIEEIKTSRQDLDIFIEENLYLHLAQAKIYAFIYAADLELERIFIQMTYYHLDSGVIRSSKEEYVSDDLRIFFMEIVSKYLKWQEKLLEWYCVRNKSISAAEFPYPDYRLGQQDMMRDVREVIHNQGQMMIQAPTGIGKTAAVLFPAVKALGESEVEKIFYLTARTTGRVIAEQTLKEFNDTGLHLKCVTITAKEKVCLSGQPYCLGSDCPYARGYYDRLPEARTELFSCDVFDQETIQCLAKKYRICPFEFSLDLCLWTDCIICDFNYAFDPRVYLKRFFLESSLKCVFLIDEAHNLVDRSRHMFSAEIRKSAFLDLCRKFKDKNPEIFKVAGQINNWMRDNARDLNLEKKGYDKERPEDLLPHLNRLCQYIERIKLQSLNPGLRFSLMDLYFETLWFLKVADSFDSNYVTVIDTIEKDVTVKLLCLDSSGSMRAAFERAGSSILFSATITPMEYFAQVLGCREDLTVRIFPSPFPRENLCLLLHPNISTLYKNRSLTRNALVKAIGTLVEAKKGNYLVFFPSYEYLKMVYPIYAETYPQHILQVQSPSMSEEERILFLDRFSSENSRTLVGFVVMGGIFGEGIDLAGDRLTGAVIVGVGLPGISLERELIKEHFSRNEMPGFKFAYQFPGMNRVFQAAGRVIRSETDRGVVLLIDSRYHWPEYNCLFPEEWNVRIVSDGVQLEYMAREFWKSG